MERTAIPPRSARGLLITFEGGDGAGKTTHIRFLADHLRQHGREVVCVREPGATAVGERLREVVLDPALPELAPMTELFIYEAARAQLVHEVIAPALQRGAVVLCDRFSDSTVAYQGYGRGIALNLVRQANDLACQGVEPDRTVLMVTGAPASVGLHRATRRTGADRIEQAGEAFHERVAQGFDMLAAAHADRVRVVTSASRKSDTSRKIFAQLSDLFPWMADRQLCPDALFDALDAPREARHG
ncbi:dTMP kinase [Eggerthellaceae bacterium zg-1084]|uniref:Thymidylate kinase n=1 Tax=Berryella wangjianweii TaxID=2734634 RepID=A0A6M8J8P3_9ACTN|nr:dTMP kinase [Berryella wangjianweii]NPD30553.1 dTMP kinase [Berryella wangjianweii]NPD32230.1 dTMP kinase [Eggerthellaceae bacterium zg-997]QKF07212.1 dTMP kinase [Berryella wangjianweii]